MSIELVEPGVVQYVKLWSVRKSSCCTGVEYFEIKIRQRILEQSQERLAAVSELHILEKNSVKKYPET
jgi:hypothetical protein